MKKQNFSSPAIRFALSIVMLALGAAPNFAQTNRNVTRQTEPTEKTAVTKKTPTVSNINESSANQDEPASDAQAVKNASATEISLFPSVIVNEQSVNAMPFGLFNLSPDEKAETPVTETAVIRRSSTVKNLRDWFATFFAHEQVGEPVETVAGGFPALVFDADIGGQTRRGIAVDYGEFVMYHFTTDKTATDDDLGKAAFDRMEMVARAATDLDPNNKDRCNCVLFLLCRVR